MSKMLAEIKRIVTEDVSNRITQYDVLYEAITNAIHANATSVICTLHSVNIPLEGDEGALASKKLDTIKVLDNGDGLTTVNYESFCKYRTEHKKALGCKGVGRFIFLKVYKNIIYTSFIKEDQQKCSFAFNFDFDTDNVKKEKAEVKNNSTHVEFISLSPQYLDNKKDLDKRITIDLGLIREKVLLNLMPTLFFYKKKGVKVTIEFIDDYSKEKSIISETDIPDFAESNFKIKDGDGVSYDFKLHYYIENVKGKLFAFHCANNRTVNEFSEHDLKITLPFGYSGLLLLESDYFDRHVNHERNGFDIYPIRTDFVSPLSWEMINGLLKNQISNIVKQRVPETEQINAAKLEDIQNERPYLTNYIEEEDIDMAGFLDKKHIIDKAKKRFDTAKEGVLSNAGKEEYTDKELQEAIQIAQNELVSYVNDRAQVLERLIKLVDKKEKIEEIIHNLFMEKGSTDDYFALGKNNLWLLDDRFTSYSYAASDKRIKDVLTGIGENSDGITNQNDEPDIALFFSHNPTNPERLNSVIVELKSFDYDAKASRKKFSGIHQLRDYVKAFKTREKIEEIYAFLITDIDQKLADDLREDDYIPLFSTESPIFHRFYDKLGISIYVVSARTLIKDAEARNKVFLDIIRKQSRLNKILKNTDK